MTSHESAPAPNVVPLPRTARQSGGHAPAPYVRVLVGSVASSGRVALVETIEVRGTEPPCHCHHWEDKLLYVMAGALRLYLGGAWLDAPTGAAIWVPRGTQHTFTVVGQEAYVLTMLTPAGFEQFYEALAPAPWAEVERSIATAARYGCEITGPHPGPRRDGPTTGAGRQHT